LADFVLEPRGRKVKKIRRTFSSGVRETHKETRGLCKAATIAAIPISQTKKEKKDKGRPARSPETRESDAPFSGSSFISNGKTLTNPDDEPRSPTLSPRLGCSSVEIKVTDWGTDAGDKENRKPEVAVRDLEKNAVQVLMSMLEARV